MPLQSEKKVYIRSRRPHHPALRCDGWAVYANLFGNAKGFRCWTLKHLRNDMYHIMYQNESYLQATPDGKVSLQNKSKNCNDEWSIESTRKGYVSIKSCFDKYLCADKNFRVTANRDHCELWEQWMILDEPHLLTTPVREVYIRSCRKRSLLYDDALPALSHKSFKASNYGQAACNEQWYMMCIDDNKVAS
mmetsp:Transcript_16146/g.21124  ORF Transcript_16146/g.21124 Transcript_16146/m.21124 type:complete len:191 (+) Transcript_16146:247-819(+)